MMQWLEWVTENDIPVDPEALKKAHELLEVEIDHLLAAHQEGKMNTGHKSTSTNMWICNKYGIEL